MEFIDSQAIYQQVADHVMELVLRAAWPEGERIPSVRELAVELGVNPNTVNKAYTYLQERALIHNQRGIGYFVSDGAVGRARELKRDEFFGNELPRVFRLMDLLGIAVDAVTAEFARYRKGTRR